MEDENVRGVVSLTEDFEMKGMIPTEKVHDLLCYEGTFTKRDIQCNFEAKGPSILLCIRILYVDCIGGVCIA